MTEDMLMRLGIPTFTATYYTQLTKAGKIMIGQDMPKPVGWIYGLSVNPAGVTPENVNQKIISYANAALLWLYLKIGPDLYVDNYRLDNLIFVEDQAATTKAGFANPRRYLPIGVPNVTDLKQSYYMNPTGIGTTGEAPIDRWVPLTIHYIDKVSYDILVQKGYFYSDVKALPPASQNRM